MKNCYFQNSFEIPSRIIQNIEQKWGKSLNEIFGDFYDILNNFRRVFTKFYSFVTRCRKMQHIFCFISTIFI